MIKSVIKIKDMSSFPARHELHKYKREPHTISYDLEPRPA